MARPSGAALGGSQNWRLNPIDSQRAQAQLRFWVGRGVERKSDAVEWSEAIVDFALTELNLRRVYALQLERHPLAGHVLAAIGMQPEGLVRKRIYKGGLVEDFVCWTIVSNDWRIRSIVVDAALLYIGNWSDETLTPTNVGAVRPEA